MGDFNKDIDETYTGWATRWGWIPGLVVIILMTNDEGRRCTLSVKSTPTAATTEVTP